MAYADANQTGRKFGAGASVLAIEVGIAWGIVAALGMTISRVPQTTLDAYTVHPEDKKVVPPPPAPPTAHPVDTPPDRPINDFPQIFPTALPTFSDPFTNNDGGGIAEIPIPRPTPPPVPTYAPKAARPAGNYANWVTTDDYPTSGLRGEHEGSTRYRLSVDAAGKATGCTVTGSSGFADLDAATCATLLRRAKFVPASDESGAKVAGSFSGTVTWRLPEE